MATPAREDPPKLEEKFRGLNSAVRSIRSLIDAVKWLFDRVRKQRLLEGKNVSLTETETGTRIDCQAGGLTADEMLLPYTPYPAPDTSGGNPPSDQALYFMIRQCPVSDGLYADYPSNVNGVFKAPPNCDSGYSVWMDSTLDQDGNITGRVYGMGTNVPPEMFDIVDGSGNLPAHAYAHLFTLFTDTSSILYNRTVQARSKPLQVAPFVVNITTDGSVRRAYYIEAEPYGS